MKSNVLSALKCNIIYFLLCLIYISSNAQNANQTIRGTIIDSDSKSALPSASVFLYVNDTVYTTTTSVEGKFRFDRIPLGRHKLKASYVGYDDAFMNNLVLTAGKELVITLALTEKIITGEEVIIVGNKDKTKSNNEMVTNSSRNFNNEETERYAGSRGDPSKMVANYAGVATGNDARNDIIVRGNSPLGVLWRLEGVDIPNPNHFSAQGATGGPVSILNNNLLGASDFLTGAFPSEYGNKYAAVFDLKIKNGNNEKYEYLGQIGFNGIEAGIEGPISKSNGSSFLFNYRYSTFEFFKMMGIDFGVSGIPKYTDACYKLFFPTNKAGVFSIWGIGGMSRIELLASELSPDDWSYISSGEDLRFGSVMGANGFSHLYYFSPDLSGKLSLSASGSKFGINIDTLSVSQKPYRTYENNSTDGNIVANYTLNWKLNAKHLLKAGLNFQQMYFNYHSEYWSRIYLKYVDELNEKNDAGLLQSYIHWQYRVSKNVIINSGIHHQSFLLNNTHAVEPRLGTSWQLSNKQSFSIAGGLHSQTQPLVLYFYKSYNPTNSEYLNNTRNLDFTKSIHCVFGYNINLNENLRFKSEAYYQHLYNIPVEQYKSSSFSFINSGSDLEGIPLVDSLINEGKGRNYGVELTFEKFFSKNYYFLTTLTLYESKYKGSDGIERHSAFSGGYIFNQLGGYEYLFKNKKFSLAGDIKITFAGGNRTTPINLQETMLNEVLIYNDSLAFSEKLKDYRKTDFKITFRINKKNHTHNFFVNVENIFNRKNILRQSWNPQNNSIKDEYQLGLFPYIGYRIDF